MRKFSVVLSAALLTAGFCVAQEVKEDFKPSTKNQPQAEYPQVNSQGYARFRIQAPDAQFVSVNLGLGGTHGGTDLVKGEDGYWTGTTSAPLDEGFHYYHLTIDGGTFNDPGTKNYYGSTRWESGIEIPAHDQLSMRSAISRTALYSRFWFGQRAPTACVAHSFTHLLHTMLTRLM